MTWEFLPLRNCSLIEGILIIIPCDYPLLVSVLLQEKGKGKTLFIVEGQLAFPASFQALHLLRNNPKEIIHYTIALLKASIGSRRPMGYSQNIVQNFNSNKSPEWLEQDMNSGPPDC